MKTNVKYLKSLVFLFILIIINIQAKAQNADSSMVFDTTSVVIDTSYIKDTTFTPKSFQKTLGYGEGRSIIKDSTGNIYVAGQTNGSASLTKLDSAYNKIWTRSYISGIAYDVKKTTDGGFVLTGATSNAVNIIFAVFLIIVLNNTARIQIFVVNIIHL